MTTLQDNCPELTFREAEAEVLRAGHALARVILEYGSGGSTVLAAGMPEKLVFSVESDRDWAIRLQHEIRPATCRHQRPSIISTSPQPVGAHMEQLDD